MASAGSPWVKITSALRYVAVFFFVPSPKRNDFRLIDRFFGAIAVVKSDTFSARRLLGQRLAFRFRGEWQRGQTHQKNQAHRYARITHGIGVTGKHSTGQQAERERSGGGDQP